MEVTGNLVRDRLLKWIGRDVVVEGTFPIPMPNGGVAYAPARGKLVAVFDDGFEIVENTDVEGTVYLYNNIRSVHPISEIAQARTMPSKLIT